MHVLDGQESTLRSSDSAAVVTLLRMDSDGTVVAAAAAAVPAGLVPRFKNTYGRRVNT